jgi:hypothetical protein
MERLRFRFYHARYATFAPQNRWKLRVTLATCLVAVLIYLLVNYVTH